MNMNLREYFDNLGSACGCRNLYCTTCGGIQNGLDTSEVDLLKMLKDIGNAKLTKKDFTTPKGYSNFALPQLSEYASFIFFLVEILSPYEQSILVDYWLLNESQYPDILVDGMGYYFIPSYLITVWKPVLQARAFQNESIRETLCLKY